MLPIKSLFHILISVQYFSKTISAEKYFGFNRVEDSTAPIGRVISFVNFENDFENELILLSKNQKEISIWNSKQNRKQILDFGPLQSNEYIVNAIPADFNNDGYLDIALVTTKLTFLNNEESSFLILGLGNGSTITSTGRKKMSITLPQPFVADITGTLVPALIGYTLDQPAQLVSFTYNAQHNSDDTSNSFDFITRPFLLDGPECKLAHPHSSSFVDLNGDCLADLLLHCFDEKTHKFFFQIWIAETVADFDTQHEPKYKFTQQYDLPEGAGQFSLADMNADGTIDIVFYTCSLSKKTDCAIHILYNSQIPTCSANGPTPCRDPHNLCTADASFKFEPDSNENHYQKLIKELVVGNQLVTRDDSFTGTLPLSLKIGDYNNDGFPDIMLVVSTITSNKQKTVQILESKPFLNGKRDFQLIYTGMEQVTKIKSVLGAAFLDQNNDGALDLIVVYQEPSTGEITFATFLNNYFFDAFFFKTVVLNGVCLGTPCPSINELAPSLHPNITLLTNRPYGVNHAGASLKLSIANTKGIQRVSQYVQLPQQAYQPLLSAWNVIGLGRTNNYVDDLFVGVSRKEIRSHSNPPEYTSRHVSAYQGIIPNAAIVISPFEPVQSIPRQGIPEKIDFVENPDASSSSWRLELYMNPSSTVSAIILVLASVLVLLSFVIGFLELMERREDHREKQLLLHALNFDAL